MKYVLDRPQTNSYPTDAILEELRRVAAHYKYKYFTRHEFDAVATYCKGSVVLSRFGKWQTALDSTGLTLPKEKKDRSFISNQELFEELGRVWRALGHRPSKDEWNASDPKYSYTTYKTRFSGWVNACAAFIDFVSSKNEEAISGEQIVPDAKAQETVTNIPQEKKRTVPLKLRLKVLERDKFKCVLCGRSPVTDIGIVLHLDHIVPYSKGGETTFENLRTLCQNCNWGKGDQI